MRLLRQLKSQEVRRHQDRHEMLKRNLKDIQRSRTTNGMSVFYWLTLFAGLLTVTLVVVARILICDLGDLIVRNHQFARGPLVHLIADIQLLFAT